MSIVLNKVGAIFIPVQNIENARDWYCSLLEMEPTYDIIAEHLCCIPLDNNGLNIVLDSKIYIKESPIRIPLFHFNTDDIEAAFQYIQDKGIELVSEIEFGHYFSFKDPDGNLLMICKC